MQDEDPVLYKYFHRKDCHHIVGKTKIRFSSPTKFRRQYHEDIDKNDFINDPEEGRVTATNKRSVDLEQLRADPNKQRWIGNSIVSINSRGEEMPIWESDTVGRFRIGHVAFSHSVSPFLLCSFSLLSPDHGFHVFEESAMSDGSLPYDACLEIKSPSSLAMDISNEGRMLLHDIKRDIPKLFSHLEFGKVIYDLEEHYSTETPYNSPDPFRKRRKYLEQQEYRLVAVGLRQKLAIINDILFADFFAPNLRSYSIAVCVQSASYPQLVK